MHGYTLCTLEASMAGRIEESLWNAIRSLEELAMLLEKAAGETSGSEAAEMLAQAGRARRRAAKARQALLEA